MNILTLDNDLTSSGIVAGFETLEFTKALNTVGTFKLTINNNNKTAKYLTIGKILYIDEHRIGYIEKTVVSKKINSKAEILTVHR